MIILASKSPRRQELLKLVGIEFVCEPSKAEEVVPEGMKPEEMPEYLSGIKAEDIALKHPGDIIIGSDTLVEFEGITLGKPHTVEEAKKMLRRLSGRKHKVYTGVTIISPLGRESFTSVSEVEFYDLDEELLDWYVGTGEPMDKAGAYGIQGYGAVLVKSINGDYFTIMGLPIAEVAHRIRRIQKELE